MAFLIKCGRSLYNLKNSMDLYRILYCYFGSTTNKSVCPNTLFQNISTFPSVGKAYCMGMVAAVWFDLMSASVTGLSISLKKLLPVYHFVSIIPGVVVVIVHSTCISCITVKVLVEIRITPVCGSMLLANAACEMLATPGPGMDRLDGTVNCVVAATVIF